LAHGGTHEIVGLPKKGRPASHDPSFSQKPYDGVSFAGAEVHGPFKRHVPFGDHIEILPKVPLREHIFPRFIISDLTKTGDALDIGFFKTFEELASLQDLFDFMIIHFHLPVFIFWRN
jgi:hypothetical protein